MLQGVHGALRAQADSQTDAFRCREMAEGRPWRFQADAYALAGTLHCLLFGEYMIVERALDSAGAPPLAPPPENPYEICACVFAPLAQSYLPLSVWVGLVPCSKSARPHHSRIYLPACMMSHRALPLSRVPLGASCWLAACMFVPVKPTQAAAHEQTSGL